MEQTRKPGMSPTFLVLGALVAGGLAGLAAASAGPELARSAADWIAPIGGLWLNALRMTLIPLIFAMLITGINMASEAARAGRVAARTLTVILIVMFASAAMAALVMPMLLNAFPVPEAARAAFTAQVAKPAAEAVASPTFSDLILGLVPTNPIAAATNDAILPLMIFAMAVAFAMLRLPAERRKPLTDLFASIGDTMIVIINFVLWLAPIGVFALAFATAAQSGAAVLGGLVHYVLIVSALGLVMLLAAYVVGLVRNGPAFLRAMLPSQAVAISTQSSMASLPAMLRGTTELGVPVSIADITLPMAVAMMRATGPAMNLGVALYVAHLAGIDIGPDKMIMAVFVAALTSLASVSLPGQVSFVTAIAPLCIVLGAPLEPLALLVAIETLPDIMRTLGNVTMDVAVTTVVNDRDGPTPTPTS